MPSRIRLPLALAAALAISACADPPTKELQQAQTAIDAARAAGADEFAHDEFTAATDALKRANDAVTDRDYRLALNNALDARERAENAQKEAATQKASARRDAERAAADAAAALTGAKKALEKADAGPASARTLAAPRQAIAREETAVQEARARFDQGDYRAAERAMRASAANLHRISADLESTRQPPPRRRGRAPRRN
jgi:hypothetical protein